MQAAKSYTVDWRFISLSVLNEDKEPPRRCARPTVAGLHGLRVPTRCACDHGNDAVATFYTELGNRIHVEGGVRFRGDTGVGHRGAE